MSFSIKKEEYVNKTFRLRKELVEKCSNEASARDVSLNSFVTAALEYALENLERPESESSNK